MTTHWALQAFGLLVYWAFHYSKFAQSYHEAAAPPAAMLVTQRGLLDSATVSMTAIFKSAP